ncbi:uncharacterized protein LOC120536745 isoform X2 [Polypterus senegalus]|uniref:uncharacterized protein LOC120536745 isoform X2 n=1 Tax=Polypterus senegalus TaxID=55291 RepID=UPI0019657DC9|nr:uncharacterized protein LOC120536745 isoform X2 [Polypterus senegalus]
MKCAFLVVSVFLILISQSFSNLLHPNTGLRGSAGANPSQYREQDRNKSWAGRQPTAGLILINDTLIEALKLICPPRQLLILNTYATAGCTLEGSGKNSVDCKCFKKDGPTIAKYNGESLNQSVLLDVKNINQGNISLIFPSVQHSDGGNYTCCVFNETIFRCQDLQLDVEVTTEKLTNSMQNNTSFPEGDSSGKNFKAESFRLVNVVAQVPVVQSDID